MSKARLLQQKGKSSILGLKLLVDVKTLGIFETFENFGVWDFLIDETLVLSGLSLRFLPYLIVGKFVERIHDFFNSFQRHVYSCGRTEGRPPFFCHLGTFLYIWWGRIEITLAISSSIIEVQSSVKKSKFCCPQKFTAVVLS